MLIDWIHTQMKKNPNRVSNKVNKKAYTAHYKLKHFTFSTAVTFIFLLRLLLRNGVSQKKKSIRKKGIEAISGGQQHCVRHSDCLGWRSSQ